MLREGKASGRRTTDDSAQFGWKAALRHNIPVQCMGQPILPEPFQVSLIKYNTSGCVDVQQSGIGCIKGDFKIIYAKTK